MQAPVNLYKGRSEKQPRRWCCCNPTCWEEGQRFEFEGEKDQCPKCKASGYPFVLMLCLIHMLVPDDAGPIQSMGRRVRLACDPLRRREHLATKTNNEAATGEPGAVNCPGCRKEIEKQKIIVAPSGQVLVAGSF